MILGQQVFAIDQIQNVGLEIAPELGAPIGGWDPQCQGQAAAKISTTKIRFREIDGLTAVGLQF